MAIEFEQDKKKVNWFALLSTAIIVVVLFAGVYYLFFKKPELIEVVAPGSLSDVRNISKISFHPEEVVNSPNFKLLRQYGTDVLVPTPGRSNPFSPF